MKYNLTLAAISMIVGFLAAQWFFGSIRSTVTLIPPVVSPVAAPEVAKPENEFRFTLTTADIPLDREYPTVVADQINNVVVVAWAAATLPNSGNTRRTIWMTRSSDGGRNYDAPKPWREVPVYAYTSSASNKLISESPKKEDEKSEPFEKSKPTRAPMTFSTHILPRLIMAGDRMILGWVEALNGGPKAVFYIAESTDGGLSFGEPRSIGGSDSSRPGFISLAADEKGLILATWLDNPTKSDNTNGKKLDSSGSGGAKVFAAREKQDKSGFEPIRLVYEGPDGKGVCPCCDVTVAASSENHMLYAFRNNVGDIRDIWIGNVNGDKTIAPAALSSRGWKFAGCPHDGPSMIKADNKIITGWMDAKDGKPRVYLSEFDQVKPKEIQTMPVTPSFEGSQSHLKIIPDNKGGIYMAWDQSELKQPGMHGDHKSDSSRTSTARGIVVAHRPNGFQSIQSRIEFKSSADRLPRNPAIAVTEDGVILAWTELGGKEGKSVRIQRIDQSSLDNSLAISGVKAP